MVGNLLLLLYHQHTQSADNHHGDYERTDQDSIRTYPAHIHRMPPFGSTPPTESIQLYISEMVLRPDRLSG